MGSRLRPEALARAASRHPWRTLALWAVLIVAAVAASSALLDDALTTDGNFTNRPDSVRARDLVEQRLRGPERDTELVVVRSPSRSVDDPAFRARVLELQGDIAGLGTGVVQRVGSVYQLEDPSLVSRDRHATLLPVVMAGAIELAGATASRAVLFSGITVVLALVGMLLIPTTIFRSLATGAILVVIAAVAASLTLLPALLGLLGDRVNALRVRRRSSLERERQGGIWVAISRAAMRRPVLSLLAAVAFLVVASTSVFDLRTGFAGVSTLPDDFASKRAFTVLATEFSGGLTTPVEVVVDGDADDQAVRQGVERLRALLAADRGFGPSAVEVNDARDLSVVSASVTGDPSGAAAVEAVTRIREVYVAEAFPAGTPAKVLVGGETAFNKDFFDLTDTYTPIVFGFVLLLSLLLLTAVFRSIVVPVKSILLNLLSVLFGLSMDYHVFLLSRIREHYDRTGNNAESVAEGVRTSAGIITGAALI